MRSRDTLIRLQQFKVEEKQRDVQDIEAMIADFARKENDLLQMISNEEERSGVSDPSHFSYPTTAKASRDRRDNLLKSIEELDAQLADTRAQAEAEEAELRKVELMAEKGLLPRKPRRADSGDGCAA